LSDKPVLWFETSDAFVVIAIGPGFFARIDRWLDERRRTKLGANQSRATSTRICGVHPDQKR
jgi:hypothetical protein